MKIEHAENRANVLKFIAQSSIYGNLGLFIGTGLSMAIMNTEDTEIALSWGKLIQKCAGDLKLDLESIQSPGQSYPDLVSAMISTYAKKKELNYPQATKIVKEKICDLTSWYPSPEKRQEYGDYLENMNPGWVITTNYDLILECLLTGRSISLGPDDQLIAPAGIIPIYHLHGVRTNPGGIVLTQEDYVSLFRPNEYRHTKLPLTIKESTTLIIGYSLGDVNVLTAVDWSRNVFKDSGSSYPSDIIQVVRNKEGRCYRAPNNIVIVETDSLDAFFEEVGDAIQVEIRTDKRQKKTLDKLNNLLNDPTRDQIDIFINDEENRHNILKALSKFDTYVISGFLEMYTRAIDETWVLARPSGAFWAYELNLNINLDILIMLDIKKMPPALIETVAYNLNKIAYFVGPNIGQSAAAEKTWRRRKGELTVETIHELRSIAKVHWYSFLRRLLSD
ncbi:SIR2 family protein [Mucilaginibacter sp. AW1-7]|uniref:SIR2 family NAD-dependent protein deacylase n=1 Tax=Mucilaginibacter sp. AW1-7 TaxID=3349874 RepID=UPI003F7390B5